MKSSTKIKPMVNAEVLDGSALVHMLILHKCKTFDDYAEKVFFPHTPEKLESVDRLDIIWDRYLLQILKQTTRQERAGKQLSFTKIKECTPIPSSWGTFLKLEQNKARLSIFSPKVLVLLQQKRNSYALHLKTILSVLPTSTMSMI